MTISTSEQHLEFLNDHVLGAVKKTFDNNQIFFGFMVLGQAIEILGSYLDDKPMRAKQQSLKRFSIAINRLFPPKYREANESSFLYYQLRACMTHMFVPTAKLNLISGKQNKEKPHLSISNGVMSIYSEDFLTDFTLAVSSLQKRISDKKLRLKTISAGEIDSN